MNRFDQSHHGRLWKLHGVSHFPLRYSGLADRINWKVFVSGVDVILLLVKTNGALITNDINRVAQTRWTKCNDEEIKKSHILRKVQQLAVRAVYALGERSAVVFIARDEFGKPIVQEAKIMSTLRMRQELQRYAPHALDQQREDVLERKPIMLGTDIELILCQVDGQVVPAERFLPRHGKAGCDPARWEGELGYPLLELRPSPSENPAQLLGHLWQSAQIAMRSIGDARLRWHTGGMPVDGFPLGGHIHISGIAINERLLRVLDNYVALPLLMLEDHKAKGRRPKFGYLGDFRRKSHGGFEYRTLSSWMYSPKYALAVLQLIKLVVEHYERLKLRPLYEERLQRYFYAGSKAGLLRYVKLIWRDLADLPAYQANKKRIEALRRRSEAGTAIPSERDIKEAWKLKVIDEQKVTNMI